MRTFVWFTLLACLLLAACGSISAQRQYRGYWVDTWNSNIASPTAIDNIIANVQLSNCNLIMAQVRRRGDAFFPSPLEPWCTAADSSFDTLDYLIKKCHAAVPRIEVHAYMVTFPVNTSGMTVNPGHPRDLYPQFFTKNNAGVANGNDFDPGHPECLKHTADVYLDVLQRYDLDGIHFDYVRFLGNIYGYNDQSVARFNSCYGRTGMPVYTDDLWEQWRRDQVTGFVRQVYARTLAAQPERLAKGFRPWVNVNGATIPWGNGPTTEEGWYSTSAYTSIFQDWRAWMEEGILDINMPMNYDREYDSAQKIYYDNWIEYEKNHKYNRHLAIGPGIYMNYIQDSITQIREALAPSALGNYADGVVMFSYQTTNGIKSGSGDTVKPNSDFYNALSNPNPPYDVYNGGNPPFPTKVLAPTMPWKESPTTANLMGVVTQQSGSQSAWADLATVEITGPVSRSQRVDGNGFYAFIDIPAGTYTVTASKGGFGSQTKSITVANGTIPALHFHLGGTDTTPPTISGVGVVPNTAGQVPILSDSKAVIVWNTDEPADSRVEYGLTTSYGMSTLVDNMLSGTRFGYLSAPRGHIVSLCNLTPNTTYHYRVISRDSSGNERISGDYTFTTLGTDTTRPGLSNIQVSSITGNSAVITWETTEAATSRVEYGTDHFYGSLTTLDPALVTNHSVMLAGLLPTTIYHFRVRSKDAANNEAISWDISFTTTTSDGTPPIISNVQAQSVTATGATITWETNEAATSQVEYGLTAAYGSLSALDTNLVLSHSVSLTELIPNTTYHYRVLSKDAGNNLATSVDYTFTTKLQAYGEIIIDNTDPGFQIDMGEWSTGTMATDKYGTNYRWCNLVAPGTTPTAVARWTPDIPVSGYWKVYAWWPQGWNRPTNSPYRIYHAGGNALVRVNQQADGGKWNLLGSFPMVAGTANYVTMSNDAEPSNYVTMADAVKFVPDVQVFTSPANFVRQSWNLVSLPAEPQDNDPISVLAGIDVPNSSLQYWQNNVAGGGYQNYGQLFGWTGPMVAGMAYWFTDPEGNKTLSFTGLESITNYQVTIPAHTTAPYWIMLGHPFNHVTLCSNIQFSTPSHPTPLGWVDAAGAGIVEAVAQCFRNGSYVTTGPSVFMVENDRFEPWHGYWLMLRTTEPVTITIPVSP